MKKNNFNIVLPTNDLIIRSALKKYLEIGHAQDRKLRIIEELRVSHGTARIDIAVVNGSIHGYEIKSDQDTLQRLPEQMIFFNAVFDKLTLVVGKSHLHDAIKMVPDWWGIMVAKVDVSDSIIFNFIREAENNNEQDGVSIARLLWREEALRLLDKAGEANGFFSKPRDCIYERLSTVFDQKTLREKVRETIFLRTEWRPDAPLQLNGG